MQSHSQQLQFYFLLILLAGFCTAEYFFLGLIPSDSKLYLMGLKLFAKAGLPVRALFCILYPLAFAMRPIRLQDQQGRKNEKVRRKKSVWRKLFLVAFFILGACVLCSLHYNPYFRISFPLSMSMIALGGYFTGQWMRRQPVSRSVLKNDHKKNENAYSFHFQGKDLHGRAGSWVNIVNPFRGTLVIGGAGSGKSHSVAEPILAQAAQKGYCGILYDFKFPTLTNFAYSQYQNTNQQANQEDKLSFWIVNFEDMQRTHRINPLNPAYIPVASYASEYALSIINNLLPETIAKPDFWSRSAQSLLTATIWYLKKYYPRYCTIPHAVNLIVYKDYTVLLEKLATDFECASMIRSILTAVEMKASNQTAGMVSTLQLGLGRINTPEICYVLSGDEVSLDLNDPKSPKVLCIGTSPTLSETFSPVISCLVTVALKLMNQQGKRHSYVLLDEAPTLYIPHLDQLPATARSNKVATIYMAQDFSQMRKQYGQNEAEVLISNLNNQFFGRVANLHTAEYVSRLFGKEERVIRSESSSDNRPRGFLMGQKGNGSQGSSVSHSLQERTVIHPQELLNLAVGHFVGTTVETVQTSFSMSFVPPRYKSDSIPPIRQIDQKDILENYNRIILESSALLEGVLS
ncbi:type IV secretory system conjugative DNA transfer family protein [Xanthocytophaga agilis]|uniref:TraM recognition domain-containing protein n=1 Tax=Xanthocytophaga agilis TaxID=3048010 RepID=A0AAE3RCH8_9BACT|nr:type IV secretory system conjugative DNA transfer family protein [Xanthocytophaga agilis]MDJ1505252.1 TraM recognition domain-containing protein [Xanthocytophaga agilis]